MGVSDFMVSQRRKKKNRFKVRTACNPEPVGIEERTSNQQEKTKRSKTCAFVSVTIARNMCATLLSPPFSFICLSLVVVVVVVLSAISSFP